MYGLDLTQEESSHSKDIFVDCHFGFRNYFKPDFLTFGSPFLETGENNL